MKFRALNTFTFLFILSFLFVNVSGGIVDGITKAVESKIKNFIPPSYLRNFPNKELVKKVEELKRKTEKVKDRVEDMIEAKDYLEKFGFLNSSTSPSDSEVKSSIIKFQKFYNLKTTGKLDENTTDALIRPRCGVPDNVNTTFKPWWTGKELKYVYLNKNVANKVKSLFQNAFIRWSKVTGLNFTETMSIANSNFVIAFINLDDGKGKMVGGTYINKANNYRIMYFDIEEHWVSSKSVLKEDEVDLESFVMHQIGHLLGLEHSSVEEAVMYPIVLPKQKIELVNDDLQKIQKIYNVKNVKNDASNSTVKNDASNSNVKNDASDSSWPVVFWPLSFLGFVVCFLGLL